MASTALARLFSWGLCLLREPNYFRVRQLLGVLACLSILLLSATAIAAPSNLLAGKSASRADGVRRAHVLTDGIRAAEGDDWDTDLTSIFASNTAFVEYDLKSVVPIAAAYLQGDNNDHYTLLGSEDGKSFRALWTGAPQNSPGQRERFTNSIDARARYLRVTARAGDGAYSLTEIQVFSEPHASLPPELVTRAGIPEAAKVRSLLLYFGVAMTLFLAFFYRGAPNALRLLALLAPLVAGVLLVRSITQNFPIESRELSVLRALTAALGVLALIRERVFTERYPAERVAVLGTLLLSGVLACLSFYNLGRPQYWNHHENRPEFVHTYDMRVYHPFAKYFRELGYDGVYLASVAAYAEDVPGASLESLHAVEVRSLKTHRLQKVAELGPEIQAVKSRFSSERWQSFKRDMQYFRNVMGPEYLRTLNDHGANATPVWVLFAHALFAFTPASEGLLVFGGLVDALLLAGLFVAILRVFGARAAFLAMILFGANDLYMFGTNWGGATLRHDWLALLGFGVCALGAKRWATAGVCFALSVMIRAFPALALAGVAVPVLWWAIDHFRSTGRLPNPRLAIREHPEVFRVLSAAALCMLLCVVVTSILFSPGAWLEWWRKISMLNSDTAVNDVSFRALIAGTDNSAGKLFRLQKPLYIAGICAALALVAWVCRKRDPVANSLLALPLIPVLMNPSNYYNHFIFLLPLIGAGTNLLRSAAPFLAMCIAQYWTTLDPDPGRHFELETALLFASFGWFFYNVATTKPVE